MSRGEPSFREPSYLPLVPPRLGQRFWLFFALPALLGSLGLGALAAWLDTEGRALGPGSIAWLAGWPLMALVLAAGAVVAWRASTAAAAARAARITVVGTRAAIVLVLLGWGVAAGACFVPHVSARLQAAGGNDPDGAVQATLSPDGRRLRLTGHLGHGDAVRVQALMQAAPRLALLEIDSLDARLHEARQLASTVQAQQLPTRVLGECVNACSVVFLAGSRRELMPQAQLRLYPPPVGTLNPLWRHLSRQHLARSYAAAGWSPAWATRIASMSPAVPWRPDAVALTEAGLVGVPGWPLDVVLPAGAGASAAEFAEALSASTVWRALDKRFPGTVAQAAERLHAAAAVPGVLQDTLQVAAQGVVQALLPALMGRADPFLREKFVALLAEQLRAVQAGGASACRKLLEGNAALRRSLPSELRLREAAWIVEAAAEPDAAAAPARKRADLEMEVLRRVLGASAAGQIGTLWGPVATAGAQRGCERAGELLSAVLALPPAERRAAVRLILLD